MEFKMTLTSNSAIDFIALGKASGTDIQEMIASDDFSDYFREYLSEKVVEIEFTKKDGTTRKMTCTRNFGSIPADKHPKGTGHSVTGTTIQAFDTEIQEWRSFNTESLTRINWQ
jgi:hypothetical protein